MYFSKVPQNLYSFPLFGKNVNFRMVKKQEIHQYIMQVLH